MAVVGREVELARVESARQVVLEGRSRFLIVAGEAGIGKTWFVEEACSRARAAGWRALVGGCLDIGEDTVPYLPVAEILRGLAREMPSEALVELVEPGLAELSLIAPELATSDTGARLEGLSQGRVFERLLELLGRVGAASPTILVIEDVQWLDRATRDLLTFLVRNLTEVRALVVLTCRTDGLQPGHPILAWLGEIGRSTAVTRLDLGRFDRAEVARQLGDLGIERPSSDLVDRIWRRSDGNPLFVSELAATHGEAPGQGHPPTLDQILLSRISGLSEATRRTIGAVAIAGGSFDEDVVATVLDTSPEEVRVGIRDAVAQGVLAVDVAGHGFGFRHELLREVVEAELLPGERRSLHERYALALTSIRDSRTDAGEVPAAILAHHWLGAGRVGEAFRASIVAADEAEVVYAHADAHRQFERAIELSRRLPPTERPAGDEWLALLRRASDAADLAGEFGSAISLTIEALATIDPTTDPTTAGLLHSRLGYLRWAAGEPDALAEHRLAAELVPIEPPSSARARVLARLAGALMGAAQWSACGEVAEEAVRCAVGAGDRTEESLARNILGSAMVARGEIEAGIAQLRRARELAAGLGVPDTLIIAHHNLALNLLQADQFEAALDEAESGLEAARTAGLERRFGLDLIAVVGDALLRLGRWDEAEERTEAVLAVHQIGTTYLATVNARIGALRGDAEVALTRLAGIEASGLDADAAAELETVRAEAAILAGRPTEAMAAADAGLRALEGLDDILWSVPLLTLGLRAAADAAEVAAATHRDRERAAATDAGEACAARLGRLAARAATATTRAWLATASAEGSRLAGVADPALWGHAAETWEAVPDAYRTAESRYRRAEAELRLHGVRADVGTLLRDASASAARLGAKPLASAVERLARRARVRLPADVLAAPGAGSPSQSAPAAPQDQAGFDSLGLSEREIEVLALVVAGMSNGEIGERLFISRKTAAVHVTHILDKLGVSNRIEAALVAERAGLTG